MKLIKLSCQNCNAQLDIDLDNQLVFCPFCGQKLLIDLNHPEIVFAEKEKTKREQEITKRELEKTKQVQLDNEYKERKARRVNRALFFGIGFLFLIPILLFLFLNFSIKSDTEKHLNNNEIQAGTAANDFKGISGEDAKNLLTNAGFENIKLDETADLVIDFFKKKGRVESVSINGNSGFIESSWFPKNAYVIIKYHTFKPKK